MLDSEYGPAPSGSAGSAPADGYKRLKTEPRDVPDPTAASPDKEASETREKEKASIKVAKAALEDQLKAAKSQHTIMVTQLSTVGAVSDRLKGLPWGEHAIKWLEEHTNKQNKLASAVLEGWMKAKGVGSRKEATCSEIQVQTSELQTLTKEVSEA